MSEIVEQVSGSRNEEGRGMGFVDDCGSGSLRYPSAVSSQFSEYAASAAAML
ncbi:MAG: hypothetical protein IH588_19590 [Anaerolineales bacterium]|nr:hypothetical protein [Anaerolineales bacterium]